MNGRAAAWLAWTLFAVFVVLLALLGLLTATAPPPPPGVEPFSASAAVHAVAILGFMAVGALLASRVPTNPLGWLLCAFSLLQVLSPVAHIHAIAGLPGATVTAWLSSWAWMTPIALLGAVLLLFPDGHPPSRRWRWVLWVATAGIAFSLGVGVALWPERGPGLLTIDDQYPGLAGTLSNLALPLVFGSVVASALSVVVRFRRSRGDARLQLKWLAYATALVAASLTSFVVEDIALDGMQSLVGEFLSAIGLLSIPVAFAVAVLRYRLYEIDRIVSRTVSYAALTAVLALVYSSGVVVLGSLRAGSDLAVAGSTLVVAALFGPVRRRLQDVVDRRFNRARYDAEQTVIAFSARLREEVDLDGLREDLLGVVSRTFEPSRTLLWLRSGRTQAESSGTQPR